MSTTQCNSLDKYIIAIPAYNEEGSIEACLNSIYQANKRVNKNLLEIVVCVNGCTDKTEYIVRNWNKLPVKILRSKPNYVSAMNKLFSYAQKNYPQAVFIKVDADSTLHLDAVYYLFQQLIKHNKLIVVGGHPVPKFPSGYNNYNKLMAKILSIRSVVPEAEVSVLDTVDYHQYANIDPIIELNNREDKMKIYFHGRFWCIRRSALLSMLPPYVIGDDVFLASYIFNRYGTKSIRLDYRAKINYIPNSSLKRHWKVYRRIYEDLSIVLNIRGLRSYKEACRVKLDWKYIFTKCSLEHCILFILYYIISFIEKITFKYTTYNPNLWEYHKKEIDNI